jgi:hypothetical protein
MQLGVCIPGLREQRDELKVELSAEKKRRKEIARLLAIAVNKLFQANETVDEPTVEIEEITETNEEIVSAIIKKKWLDWDGHLGDYGPGFYVSDFFQTACLRRDLTAGNSSEIFDEYYQKYVESLKNDKNN